jgi:hypothetical protein
VRIQKTKTFAYIDKRWFANHRKQKNSLLQNLKVISQADNNFKGVYHIIGSK